VDAHLVDSAIFGANWSTPESHALFSERSRVDRWLRILQSLGRAQADLGIVPESSARAIEAISIDEVDIAKVADRTRETAHSMLGLIGVLQDVLPTDAGEHVCYGATVQDVSDTSASLEIASLTSLIRRDLLGIEEKLLDLAERFRDTPMLGRTHGQPGAPISFGFKVAGWADEVARNIGRLDQGVERWAPAQLAGAVGVVAFHGPDALELRTRFAAGVGLTNPPITWTASRDRPAEFANFCGLVAQNLARIANEIYNLQREEIGEVAERTSGATVGSITMPHKRNPEGSEQVVTLARVIRSLAAVMTEGMVGDHERDGRTWKGEWLVLPQLGHHILASLSLADALVGGIEVDTDKMAQNLARFGHSESQELLRRLSLRVGKHAAQSELNRVYRAVRETGTPVAEQMSDMLTAEDLAGLDTPTLGAGPEMVDAVVTAARLRREAEQTA